MSSGFKFSIDAEFTHRTSVPLTRTDTPPSRATMTIHSGLATAGRVKQMIQEEVWPNVEYIDTEAFMDAVLIKDNKTLFEKALMDMKNRKLYKNGRWTKFPVGRRRLEKGYYDAFADSANGIFQSINDIGQKHPESIPGVWLNRSSVAPTSTIPNTAKIRPDISLYSCGDTEADSRELLRTVKVASEAKDSTQQGSPSVDNQNASTTSDSKKKKRNRADKFNLEAAEKELPSLNYGIEERQNDPQTPTLGNKLKSLIVSWMRTIAVAEIKRDDWKSDECESMDRDTVTQFLTYVRYTLREQQDRRFVIGLILCDRALSIWRCDRSGVLGTRTKINIDKEPLQFIRVIASFRMLSPEQLGYDPTMKLFPQASSSDSTPVEAVESYSPALSKEQLPTSRHDLCWEITIDGKKYRTIKPLSVARTEIMNGRATLVWLGIRVEDQQVVVIKQSWRPSGKGILSEFDLYGKGKAEDCRYLPTPLAYESLASTNTSLVRKKIQLEVDSKATKVEQRAEMEQGEGNTLQGAVQGESEKGQGGADERRKAKQGGSQGTDTDPEDAMVETIPEGPGPSERREFIERTQDRIVFKGYGWPVKQFKDLHELLTVYVHVLEAYEHLYKNGVCHRDISPGNIMITFDEVTQKTKGWLIDLDHAKYCESHEPLTIEQAMSNLSLSDEDERQLSRLPGVGKAFGHAMPDRLLALLLTWLPDAAKSNPKPLRVQGLVLAGKCQQVFAGWTPPRSVDENFTLRDVGLEPETMMPPAFESRLAAQLSRTGTPGFMSHKLFPKEPVLHKAIHDGESVFWTLVYLAVTRSGPGGSRQDGPPRDDMSANAYELLRRINIVRNWCFDSQHVGRNKSQLFASEGDFETYVIPYMNPYFREPLQQLFLDLWAILQSAFSGADGIGSIQREFPILSLKKAFQKALENLPADTESSPRIQALAKKVDVQREADRQLIQSTIALLSNRSTTPIPQPSTINGVFDTSPPSQKSSRNLKQPSSPLMSLTGALGFTEVSDFSLHPTAKKRKT